MDNLNSVYWFGQPLRSLPYVYRVQLERIFHIVDCGSEVAMLSDRKVEICFFFFNEGEENCLKSASTICHNLDKKLIVLYLNDTNFILPPHSIVIEHFNVSSEHFATWIDQLHYRVLCDRPQNLLSELNPSTVSNLQDFTLVVRYVKNNISRDIREEELANLCHYSVTYFSKLFRKKMGICFRDYVTQQRIQRAKTMLQDKKHVKIAYIAYQCGYRDVSYFSRMFKKTTGMSPAIYRQHF